MRYSQWKEARAKLCLVIIITVLITPVFKILNVDKIINNRILNDNF